MKNRLALRLVAGLLCALLPACGATIPTTALSPSSVTALDGEGLPTGISDEIAPLRKSVLPDVMHTALVNAREFRVPGNDRTEASIIVGPDGNLWFTELRHIGSIGTSGQLLHDRLLRQTQSIPGALTNRRDGYIWANTAERLPPKCTRCSPPPDEPDGQNWTPYQLFKISTDMNINTIFLPSKAFLFPTNLVRMGTSLYMGMTTISDQHGSDVVSDDGSFQYA